MCCIHYIHLLHKEIRDNMIGILFFNVWYDEGVVKEWHGQVWANDFTYSQARPQYLI